MDVALITIGAFFAGALVLGLLARRGVDMDLEQWVVGGRGLGAVFVFILLAGEIFTTFTFLGAPSWAYSSGASVTFMLAYGSLGVMSSYWLTPPIWRFAKAHGLVSQADYFTAKFESPGLGILVSVVGIVAMIPYLVLQLKGLKLIVETASNGTFNGAASVWIGAAVIASNVVASGLRGSAWVSVLKDGMLLCVAVFLGVYLPWHFYGGLHRMFDAVARVKPQLLTLHGAQDATWFDSTVVLTALGFYMWPQSFGALLSARSVKVLRRNAIYLPLYFIVIVFVVFVGFTAAASITHLRTPDMALLKLSMQSFPPGVLGLIAGAGLLAAVVPGSLLVMTTATLVARNICQALRPATTDAQVALLARWLVPLVALVGVLFTLHNSRGIVTLLLLGYIFVTQLFPSVLFSLLPWRFGTKHGAAAGIVVGVAVVAYVTLRNVSIMDILPFLPTQLAGINVGLVALVLNACVFLLVSAATSPWAPVRATTDHVR
ncbi:MAG: sodium:solute symporter family protein [Rhodanobacteraceae bacterium]